MEYLSFGAAVWFWIPTDLLFFLWHFLSYLVDISPGVNMKQVKGWRNQTNDGYRTKIAGPQERRFTIVFT